MLQFISKRQLVYRNIKNKLLQNDRKKSSRFNLYIIFIYTVSFSNIKLKYISIQVHLFLRENSNSSESMKSPNSPNNTDRLNSPN